MVLISLALCADAVIGNVQEKAMKAHKSSNTEVVSTEMQEKFWLCTTHTHLAFSQVFPRINMMILDNKIGSYFFAGAVFIWYWIFLYFNW